MPQESQIGGINKRVMGGQLSMIEDAPTVNEQDTINDENVCSDEDERVKKPQVRGGPSGENENVSDDIPEIQYNESVLTTEEQQKLKESIMKRASLLDEKKQSTLQQPQAEQNVEMEASNDFEEVLVEDCSESSENDSIVEPEELRDVADEQLFSDLQKREQEEKREEHNSVILKLDGSIKDKESLLDAIKQSQQQMQSDLINLMKNQYQNKVLALTNEITQLERQKSENLSKSGNSMTQQQRKKMEEQFMNK